MTTPAPTVPARVSGLLSDEKLVLIKVFRSGPRYWVAAVRRGADKLLLKLVLDDSPWQGPTGQQFRPSDQLRTEILVVRELQKNADKLTGQVPQLAACSLEDHPWMLRQDLGESNMSVNDNPLLFRPDFFESGPTEASINLIDSYQKLTPQLQLLVATTPESGQTDLGSRMIKADLFQPNQALEPLAADIIAFLEPRRPLHDSSRNTLTHAQLFPPHVYYNYNPAEQRAGLIDWENACLSNPLQDFVALWIRGLGHPEWQADFVKRLKALGRLQTVAERTLWQMEVLLQHNLNFAYETDSLNREERTRIVDLLTRCIRETLKNNDMIEAI